MGCQNWRQSRCGNRRGKAPENEVGDLAILALGNGIFETHLLRRAIAHERGAAVQPQPHTLRTGGRNLNRRVLLHVPVNILLVVCAKPQHAVAHACKHDGAALCPAVSPNGREVLRRVRLQNSATLFMMETSENFFRGSGCFFRLQLYTIPIASLCNVNTICAAISLPRRNF